MTYLVATDGSAVSDLAIEHAAADAGMWERPLEIVHVLSAEAELINGELVLPGGDRAIERGRRTLADARELARSIANDHGAGIDIGTELLSGYPPEAITDRAEETGASRIYVGHRGLSEEREKVVGSVAKTVVDKASVPVSIVR
ncbi:universal stress protein [Natronomonas sp.]|uniref:universal stress protein n=1 Tax=Natronomonas sp. TaxID=2184060 RepID=UPI0026092A8E|nr:universal stress protein [Natronomonas sp.]